MLLQHQVQWEIHFCHRSTTFCSL